MQLAPTINAASDLAVIPPAPVSDATESATMADLAPPQQAK